MEIGSVVAKLLFVVLCGGVGVVIARWKGLTSRQNLAIYGTFAALATPLIPVMFLARNGPEAERHRPWWALPTVLVFWTVYLLLFAVVVLSLVHPDWR